MIPAAAAAVCVSSPLEMNESFRSNAPCCVGRHSAAAARRRRGRQAKAKKQHSRIRQTGAWLPQQGQKTIGIVDGVASCSIGDRSEKKHVAQFVRRERKKA